MQFRNIRRDILKVSKGSRIVWQLAGEISQIKSAILLLKALTQLNGIRRDIVFSENKSETEQALHTLTHRNVCEDILFFIIIILALHQQHSVYCDSGFHTFFFDQGCYWCWSSCKMVLHILDDLKRFLYNYPKTTIMSWQMTFYWLQWPHILPISQSALFCPLHQSVLPPGRGLKTNCQFQTICVTGTQRNKLKHEL